MPLQLSGPPSLSKASLCPSMSGSLDVPKVQGAIGGLNLNRSPGNRPGYCSSIGDRNRHDARLNVMNWTSHHSIHPTMSLAV